MTGKMSGAQYLARALEGYRAGAVFFVPTILSRALYEMEQHTGIHRILTHGEKAAVYMADGYARASGRPGVAMAQTVGAANLAAGLRDPWLGCSPVLALTGGPYTHSRCRNYYQEIEDFPLFKPVTKFSAQVTGAGRLPDLLRHALEVSVTGKPGPVHLEVFGHSGEEVEDGETDAALPESPLSVPRLRSRAPAGDLAAAAARLRAARRPVIVAGGGVRSSGAAAQLRALAEAHSIPVATSLNAKDTLPGHHPLNVGVPGLYSRGSANQVLVEADLVIFAGSRAGNQVTLNWQVPPLTTAVIQLDIDPAEIGRHYPDTLGLVTDARLGLADLAGALAAAGAGPDFSGWAARAQSLVAAWRAQYGALMAADAEPVRPERLSAELTAHLPGDAMLVSDTGHSGMWTGGMVDLKDGQEYIRAAGSLGWGLPAALGAQVARPGRPVVLFTGDGGLWYHIGELETAARRNIPAVIVVNNNRSLNQEISVYSRAYGGSLHGRHGELWHFSDTDFAAVAESMGVAGLTVRRASEFEGALDKALSGGRPALINVITEMEALAPRGSAEPAAAAATGAAGTGS
jgi:acetolactate synthase-1/2/3 large subunit